MSLITSTTGCCSCGATYYAYPCWPHKIKTFTAPDWDFSTSTIFGETEYRVTLNGECPSNYPMPPGTPAIVIVQGAGGGGRVSAPDLPIHGGAGATIEKQIILGNTISVVVGLGGPGESNPGIYPYFILSGNYWGGGGLGAYDDFYFGISGGGGASLFFSRDTLTGPSGTTTVVIAGGGGGSGSAFYPYSGGDAGIEIGGDGGGSFSGVLDFTVGTQASTTGNNPSAQDTGGLGARLVQNSGGGGGGGGGYWGGTGGDRYFNLTTNYWVGGGGGGGSSTESNDNFFNTPGVNGLVAANPYHYQIPEGLSPGIGEGGFKTVTFAEGQGGDGTVQLFWRSCGTHVDSMPNGLPPATYICLNEEQHSHIINQAGEKPPVTGEQTSFGDTISLPCVYKYISFIYKGWPYYIQEIKPPPHVTDLPAKPERKCERNVPNGDIAGPYTWRTTASYCCQVWTADILDPTLDDPDRIRCMCNLSDPGSKIYLSDDYRKSLNIPDCLDDKCHILTYTTPNPLLPGVEIVRKYKLIPPSCCNCPRPSTEQGPTQDCPDQSLCTPWNPEGITYSVESNKGGGDPVCEYLVCNTFLGGTSSEALPATFNLDWSGVRYKGLYGSPPHGYYVVTQVGPVQGSCGATAVAQGCCPHQRYYPSSCSGTLYGDTFDMPTQVGSCCPSYKVRMCLDASPCYAPLCGETCSSCYEPISGNLLSTYRTDLPGWCDQISTYWPRFQTDCGDPPADVQPMPCNETVGPITTTLSISCPGANFFAPGTGLPSSGWDNRFTLIGNQQTNESCPSDVTSTNCFFSLPKCGTYECIYNCVYQTPAGTMSIRDSCNPHGKNAIVSYGAATEGHCLACSATQQKSVQGELNAWSTTENFTQPITDNRIPYPGEDIQCPHVAGAVYAPVEPTDPSTLKQWDTIVPWKDALKIEYTGLTPIAGCLICPNTGGDCCSPRPGEKGCPTHLECQETVGQILPECNSEEWSYTCAYLAKLHCPQCINTTSNCCGPLPDVPNYSPGGIINTQGLPWVPGPNSGPPIFVPPGWYTTPAIKCDNQTCTDIVCTIRPRCCSPIYSITPNDPPGWIEECGRIAEYNCDTCIGKGDVCCREDQSIEGPPNTNYCSNTECKALVTGVLPHCSSSTWDWDCARAAQKLCLNCNGASPDPTGFLSGTFAGIRESNESCCYHTNAPDCCIGAEYVFTGVVLNNTKYRGCGTVDHFTTEINDRAGCFTATNLSPDDPFWIGQRCYGGKTCCDSIYHPYLLAGVVPLPPGAYEDNICTEGGCDEWTSPHFNQRNCGAFCTNKGGDNFRVKTCAARDSRCLRVDPNFDAIESSATNPNPGTGQTGWCESFACSMRVYEHEKEFNGTTGEWIYPWEHCFSIGWSPQCAAKAYELCSGWLDIKNEIVFEARHKYAYTMSVDVKAISFAAKANKPTCNPDYPPPSACFDPNIDSCVCQNFEGPDVCCTYTKPGSESCPLCPPVPCTGCCEDECCYDCPCADATGCHLEGSCMFLQGHSYATCHDDDGIEVPCLFRTQTQASGHDNGVFCWPTGNPMAECPCYANQGDYEPPANPPDPPTNPPFTGCVTVHPGDCTRCEIGGHSYGTGACEEVVCKYSLDGLSWQCKVTKKYACDIYNGEELPSLDDCPYGPPPP